VTKETITTAEILELLHMTPERLGKVRNTPEYAMPMPVNNQYRFLIYDRSAIENWITGMQAKKDRGLERVGLDNQLAVRFLSGKTIPWPTS
jgi:hypothetical protein